MKQIPGIALTLFGILWIALADANKSAVQARALSDAMQVEADLARWYTPHIDAGKLTRSDLDGIIDENGRLRLGGELKNQTFREMIRHIVDDASPGKTGGVLVFVLGVSSWMSSRDSGKNNKDLAEQETG